MKDQNKSRLNLTETVNQRFPGYYLAKNDKNEYGLISLYQEGENGGMLFVGFLSDRRITVEGPAGLIAEFQPHQLRQAVALFQRRFGKIAPEARTALFALVKKTRKG